MAKGWYELVDERLESGSTLERLIIALGWDRTFALCEKLSGKRIRLPKNPKASHPIPLEDQIVLIEILGPGELLKIPEITAMTRPLLYLRAKKLFKDGLRIDRIAQVLGISERQVRRVLGDKVEIEPNRPSLTAEPEPETPESQPESTTHVNVPLTPPLGGNEEQKFGGAEV